MSAIWPISRASLLIVDDFGLRPLRPPADEGLHELVAERYESAATIVTSNLDLTEKDQAAFPATSCGHWTASVSGTTTFPILFLHRLD
ncbi:MAG TPA: ATP-binding protein [Variovorax sp.]|nr:ATP-binding protein [Variovorax sp.]